MLIITKVNCKDLASSFEAFGVLLLLSVKDKAKNKWKINQNLYNSNGLILDILSSYKWWLIQQSLRNRGFLKCSWRQTQGTNGSKLRIRIQKCRAAEDESFFYNDRANAYIENSTEIKETCFQENVSKMGRLNTHTSPQHIWLWAVVFQNSFSNNQVCLWELKLFCHRIGP